MLSLSVPFLFLIFSPISLFLSLIFLLSFTEASLSGTVNGKSLSQEAVFQTAAIFVPLFLGLTVIR